MKRVGLWAFGGMVFFAAFAIMFAATLASPGGVVPPAVNTVFTGLTFFAFAVCGIAFLLNLYDYAFKPLEAKLSVWLEGHSKQRKTGKETRRAEKPESRRKETAEAEEGEEG